MLDDVKRTRRSYAAFLSRAKTSRILSWWVRGLWLLLVLAQPASAENEDDWTFVITPQLWLPHIAENGFVSPTSNNFGGFQILDTANQPLTDPLRTASRGPSDSLNQQWGVQLAAQRRYWTFAAAYQFVDFRTRTKVEFSPEENREGQISGHTVRRGDYVHTERVDTFRNDIDIAATHLFPAVLHDRVDVSVGGGVKLIYASADRSMVDLSPAAAELKQRTGGLYMVCRTPSCEGARFQDKAKSTSLMFGLTLPFSTVFHLSRDSRWLLPISISPFLGFHSRNDHGVAYRFRYDADGFTDGSRRVDGTSFAHGMTADGTIRWMISEHVSAYLGMRVQYIISEGEPYLAYGPLLGISTRFQTADLR